jgi:hypothetical protein
LKQQIKLREERDAYHKMYLEMLERYKKLERGLLRQKSEQTPAEGLLSLAIIGNGDERRRTATIV